MFILPQKGGFYHKEMKKWEEYPMPIFGLRQRSFRPILERRFSEETKLYLFGDADDTTLLYAQQGGYQADLRKVAACTLAGALVLLWLLKRK